MHNQQWNDTGLQTQTAPRQTANPAEQAANIADAILNNQEYQRDETQRRVLEARQREEFARRQTEQQVANRAEFERQRVQAVREYCARVDRIAQQRRAEWWGKLIAPACVGAAIGGLFFIIFNRPIERGR